ncbi:MAG: glutamine synthetase type III, partial [Myxococcota bacterium]
GISAKTQHNEVAPAQFELAPLYTTINIAADHNQLVMEVLQKVALHHDFVCLLHEKPFAGVNGSGKHVNWSLSTDDGMNLLEPGSTPHDNMVFLVFLHAVIKAVDKYSNLLRAMVANSGNEHRLGANEAPPAIVSIFLGEELTKIVDSLAEGGTTSSSKGVNIELGVSTLPPLPKDSTDRNRTSPFAFTGNKFEFRMVGSSQSPSSPAAALNTIVADTLCEIADQLEKAKDIPAAVRKVLQKIARDHRRILFNGDNYTNEWVEEAAKRGLPNLRSSVEAIGTLCSPENIGAFSRMGVMSKSEMHARMEINFETYTKLINIEAGTTISMARRQILPVAAEYTGELAAIVSEVKAVGLKGETQMIMLEKASAFLDELFTCVGRLETVLASTQSVKDIRARAKAYHDGVIPAMLAVRKAADGLETVVDAGMWPLPTYAEMLFLR